MILVDNTHLLIAAIMVAGKIDVDESTARHIALNSYLALRRRFRGHGEMVLCHESGNSWRKQAFPHYKAGRKEKQRKDPDTWAKWCRLFGLLDKLVNEAKESLPYRHLRVPECEADDIIAVVSKKVADSGEDVVIASSDKDFNQLLFHPRIKQWCNRDHKFVTVEDPLAAKELHIIRGDDNDGIPNILSASDSLVSKTRQSPMTEARVGKILEHLMEGHAKQQDWWPRYEENRLLIDFDRIPPEMHGRICDEFDRTMAEEKRRGSVLSYLMRNQLDRLIGNASEF